MIGSCRKAVVGLCLLATLAAPAFALQPPLNQALNEEVATIPYEGAVTLETTIFKPDGPGPFPLVVINHGKDPGNPALQARARHFAASREFVRRGYAVVLPMRAGFSKSGGSFVDTGCDIAENGRIQAGYVRAAIDHMKSRPYVDARRIVVVGQSHGGLTTMALGTAPVAGVLGLVNFAGGLKVGSCPDWPARLTRAFGDYGSGARLPSVWFYGDNDSLFPIGLARDMVQRYSQAGGNARLVAFGRFKNDAHQAFGDLAGLDIWWPETEKFLKDLGLPTALLPTAPAGGDAELRRLTDTAALPHLHPACRRLYEKFADFDLPRAFAISEEGACGYAAGINDSKKTALEHCAATGAACKLYAVDTAVVWRQAPGVPGISAVQ